HSNPDGYRAATGAAPAIPRKRSGGGWEIHPPPHILHPNALRREAGQRLADGSLAQPLERAVAQLADPLAGHAEHPADLFQGVLASAVEAEVEPQHLGVTRRQRRQRVLDLLGEE